MSREELVKELRDKYPDSGLDEIYFSVEDVANLIIADRKRVVEPLVKELEDIQGKMFSLNNGNYRCDITGKQKSNIDEALKNAGVL